MYISSISHIECPGCSGSFFIDMGDPDDSTAYTPNAVGCPWCNQRFFLQSEEFDDYEAEGEETPEERKAYELEHAEIGKKQIIGREGKKK